MGCRKGFRPMLQSDRRCGFGPMIPIGALTIVAALGGMALRAGPIPTRREATWSVRSAPMSAGATAFQGAARNLPGAVTPSRDRFVIVAPAYLDPKMVVRAREDLDVEMVVNPETWRRASPITDPAPAVVPYSPTPVPAPINPWRRR